MGSGSWILMPTKSLSSSYPNRNFLSGINDVCGLFFSFFFFFWGLLRIHPCDACLNWILSFSPQTLFISTNPREGFCVCFSWKLKIGDIFLENGSCISLSPTFHMFLCTSLWINVTEFHHQLKLQLYEKKNMIENKEN